MKVKVKKSGVEITGLILLGVLILGILSTTVLAIPPYEANLIKGTEELTVTRYNEGLWNSTVGTLINPSDWFEGKSNFINARSKITLKGWTIDRWQLYDWLVSLFFPLYYTSEEILLLLGIMESQGYNETTINEVYTSNYTLVYGLRSVWNFTIDTYEEKPSYIDDIIILQNPLSYKTVLEDYNNVNVILNGNIAIQIAGYTFPNITVDEFLWNLAFNGFSIAEPQPDYLTDVVNGLGCENVTVSGSKLIFERSGLTNYTVEISYGNKGTISSFTVKDAFGTIIYQIENSNSEWIFYLILIIVFSSSIILVILIILRKRKLKR